MKKLQNNFTTPEQSKRLLELGVPADSADCYYSPNGKRVKVIKDSQFNNFNDVFNWYKDKNDGMCTPCWSVGRLIEIIGICAGMECVDFETLAWTQGEWSEKLIRIIKDLVRYNKMDFSKLEDEQ